MFYVTNPCLQNYRVHIDNKLHSFIVLSFTHHYYSYVMRYYNEVVVV